MDVLLVLLACVIQLIVLQSVRGAPSLLRPSELQDAEAPLNDPQDHQHRRVSTSDDKSDNGPPQSSGDHGGGYDSGQDTYDISVDARVEAAKSGPSLSATSLQWGVSDADWRDPITSQFSAEWSAIDVDPTNSTGLKAWGVDPSSSQDGRPNFLIILSDDHRWDGIGKVQQHLPQDKRLFPFIVGKTPNMDDMISEGVFFTNAFVSDPLCSPSKGTLYSGEREHVHGVLGNDDEFPLPDAGDGMTHLGDLTIAERLRRQGYRTGYFGKWHMKEQLDRPGFETVATFRGQGDYFNGNQMWVNGKKTKTNPKEFIDDTVTNFFLDWLRANQDNPRPFFAVLSVKAPHTPRSPHPRTKEMFVGGLMKSPPNSKSGFPPARFKEEYFESVETIDMNMGRVRKEMMNIGIHDTTMTFYLGDNGYFLGEHGLVDKRFAYEESIKIPLIVSYPGGRVRRDSFEDALVLHMDIPATIMDYAGLNGRDVVMGRSMRPLLETTGKEIWPEGVLMNYYPEHKIGPPFQWFALRTKTEKLIHIAPTLYDPLCGGPRTKTRCMYLKGREEFYNIKNDPYELHDLTKTKTSSGAQDTIARMKKQLNIVLLREGVATAMPFFRDTPVGFPYPKSMFFWTFEGQSTADKRKQNRLSLKGGAYLSALDKRAPLDGVLVLPRGGWADISHAHFTKRTDGRTVSMWVKAEQGPMEEAQVLYDEGNDYAGAALRLKDSKMEGIIRMNGHTLRVAKRFTHQSWAHVALQYGDSEACLFLDGLKMACQAAGGSKQKQPKTPTNNPKGKTPTNNPKGKQKKGKRPKRKAKASKAKATKKRRRQRQQQQQQQRQQQQQQRHADTVYFDVPPLPQPHTSKVEKLDISPPITLAVTEPPAVDSPSADLTDVLLDSNHSSYSSYDVDDSAMTMKGTTIAGQAALGASVGGSSFGDHNNRESDFFTGQMDEVRVYGSYNAPSEANLAAMGGVVGRWKMDRDAKDVSGFTDGQGKDWHFDTNRKQGNGAVKMDGSGESIRLKSDILSRGFTSLTVCAWVEPASGTNGRRIIYEQGGKRTGFALRHQGDELQAAFVSRGDRQIVKASPLPDGQWTHVCCTFDKGNVALYMNGQERAAESIKLKSLPHHSEMACAIGESMGTNAFGERPSGNFMGSIDDVIVWDQPLGRRQIIDLHNNLT
ncbi:unnamed protein product [Vitrella brassicaformis CCMP3155]|uniref:LamG-like jellyroll fold domain-containing protein n=1 Tax=Vitrella brassicaformis (strain CCMP3155) TaxID=1169540 RepID=A0A0G4GTC3_VITBC|nr:unnamed protein product [Vitrella brassicaformis CCMP3155]|eukprot:CEM33735.1 unnamed protein product [Vitrella brassicaformis CCMP3155]